DGARIHADDLAVLTDQHDFGALAYLRDGHHFSVALGGLHVDDAGAAASLQSVFLCGRTLAVTVFGDGENQRAFDRNGLVGRGGAGISGFGLGSFDFRLGLRRVLGGSGHADDVILLVELHAAYAVGRTAHVAHPGLVEADGLAVVGSEKNYLGAVGERGADQ